MSRGSIDSAARFKNRQQERRFRCSCLSYFSRSGEDDVDRGKAVGGQLLSVTLMDGGIAHDIGDHEQIHIAPAVCSALGVRAKEHYTLGRKDANEAIERSLHKNRDFGYSISSRQSPPPGSRRQSHFWSATGSLARPAAASRKSMWPAACPAWVSLPRLDWALRRRPPGSW
jgi:hypothetical protein